MIVERESLTPELFEEIRPLAQKCWDESTEGKLKTCAYTGDRNLPVDPNWETYNHLSKEGKLLIVTLRDEGVLKGYAVGVLYKSLHHQSILCGGGDSIYLDPDTRGLWTGKVVGRFEQELKDEGAEIIGWPVTQGGSVQQYLEARGYIGDDIVMEKRL
jgi:hypothetical protein